MKTFEVTDRGLFKWTVLERVYTVQAESEEEARELIDGGECCDVTEAVVIESGTEESYEYIFKEVK